jgi:hypothetical protein
MKWAWHVACRDEKCIHFDWSRRGKRPLEKPSCKRRTTLKFILNKEGKRFWTGILQLRKGTRGRLL